MIILCILGPVPGVNHEHDYLEFCCSASRLKSGIRFKKFDGSCPCCFGLNCSGKKTIDGGITWEITDSRPCENCTPLEHFVSKF